MYFLVICINILKVDLLEDVVVLCVFLFFMEIYKNLIFMFFNILYGIDKFNFIDFEMLFICIDIKLDLLLCIVSILFIVNLVFVLSLLLIKKLM